MFRTEARNEHRLVRACRGDRRALRLFLGGHQRPGLALPAAGGARSRRVTASALTNGTVVGIAVLWLVLYGGGFALGLLPPFPSPDRALHRLPHILHGEYDLRVPGELIAWSAGVSLVTSKGAHGVPGSAIVILAATLNAVPAIPAIGLVLVLSVDWFIGMVRALGNLIGNCVATVVVAAWEKELDLPLAEAVLDSDIVVEARAA